MDQETPIGLIVVLDGLDKLRHALETERSLPEAAEILVTSAVEIVPGCDGGAVTEWGPESSTVLYASSPTLAVLEEAQVELKLHLPGPASTTLTLYGSTAVHESTAGALATLVATVGSIALSGVRRQNQLRQAIASRDVIGQAKGILMHRWKLTADSAFDVLRRASSDTNVPLRIVAERVVAEGDVPKT